MTSRKTLFITQVAMMAAIAVVVRRVLTPQIAGLNLGGFPIIMGGLLLGPVGGAYVGAISDVVGFLMGGNGYSYTPLFTLTAALTGYLPPLLVRRPTFGSLLFGISVTMFVTKILLIPLFDYYLMGWPIAVTAAKNLMVQLVHVPLYAVLANAVLTAMQRRGRGLSQSPS